MARLRRFIRERIGTVIVTAVIVSALIFAGVRAERHISSYEFCVSCHSMSYPNAETKKSSHYARLGVNPTCKDCHLPPDFFKRIMAHLVDGPKDFVGEYRYDLGTKEDFGKHRAAFAHTARITLKKRDSSPCRACHKDPWPASEYGQSKHRLLREGKATCIDCHQNLVHEWVPEEDLDKGIKEGRIVPR
ncbi:MAG: NapC/NirT family cytochrome c [Deltaproteobacteria bacterium]|nr:NapC/NirT family cytochrome c [Deltaproteobacteria bacterium]